MCVCVCVCADTKQKKTEGGWDPPLWVGPNPPPGVQRPADTRLYIMWLYLAALFSTDLSDFDFILFILDITVDDGRYYLVPASVFLLLMLSPCGECA